MSTGIKKNRKLGLILSLIFLTAIAGFAFYVNRNIKLEALYMDDLYMWSFYGEQNIWEFSFPFRTASRFRPVYWFLTYLQMAIVGANVKGYLTFNIITNIILAFTIYGVCTHVSGNRIAAFLACVCYLASRLSYYQIGQALGFMETLACFFAILVMFFLYRYMTFGPDNGRFLESMSIPRLGLNERGFFYLAVIAYVLVSFTHERYITLVAVFYLVLLIALLRAGKGHRRAWFMENLSLWIVPAATAAAIMLIRFIFIGKSIPGGTGGTEVTETFSISQTLEFCVSQVAYLLGVNDGPEYLCGISWDNTPADIKTLIKLSILCYGIIGLGFIASLIVDLKKGMKHFFCRKIAVSLLFAGFVGICILCSSITIRLEMRWVYVSFAAMQIFACYMIRSVGTVIGSMQGCDSGDLSANGADDICASDVDVAIAFGSGNAATYGVDDTTTFGSGCASASDVDAAVVSTGMNIAVILALLVYAAYVLLSIKTNVFCRGYINNIYFMEGQNRANSIAEETIYKFGRDEVLGKTVFLIGTNYEISDFYCEYFFKPFDPEKTGQGSRLVLVKTLNDTFSYLKEHPMTVPAKPPKANPDGNISENAIYLTEDPATGKYIPLNVVN